MRDLDPPEPGQKLVIVDSSSMFHGEIGYVCNETNPYPDEGVYVKLPGWPSMWWSLDSVRPLTERDMERYVPFAGPMGMGYVPDEPPCAPVSGHEEGSAPQMTDPAPIERTRGARRVSEPSGGQ